MLASDSPSQPQPRAARHKRPTEIECGPDRKHGVEKEDEIWVVHRPLNPTHSRFLRLCFAIRLDLQPLHAGDIVIERELTKSAAPQLDDVAPVGPDGLSRV